MIQIPNEAGVSVAELVETEQGELELCEIDGQSALGSITSQKCQEVVLDTPGMPVLEGNPTILLPAD